MDLSWVWILSLVPSPLFKYHGANSFRTAILYASDYTSAADDAYVDNFLKTLTAKTDAAAKAANLYYPFVFLNDAGGWQKTLSLYGRGKSFPRLNAVANKYDPDGVFQTLDGGAFKLSLEGGK